MDHSVSRLTAAAFSTVCLMTLFATAFKVPECQTGSDDGIISCYHCTTTTTATDNYCADPFNTSHSALRKVPCKDFCAKWITDTVSGGVRYTRTCSSAMNINMPKYAVCMKERGSQHGQLCLCDHIDCNSAPTLQTASVLLPLLIQSIVKLMTIFPT